MTFTFTRVDNYLVVRLGLASTAARRPLHLAFLLDVSQSMEGERMTAMKRTLHAARPLLTDVDTVTLITFGETATTVLANHSLADMDTFYTAVDAMDVDGCTNLSAAFTNLASLFNEDAPYDTIFILTDGMVNRGVTGTAGLRTIALDITRNSVVPFNMLGYGADHNRTLLRELATTTCGTYTYIEREENLPVAMGSILGGLRTEVMRDVLVTVNGEGSWIGSSDAAFRLGGIVPERDYWCVFQMTGTCYGVSLTATGVEGAVHASETEITVEAREQIMRCRVGAALSIATDELEQGHLRSRNTLVALQMALDNLEGELRFRPLILNMKGQIADVLDLSSSVPRAADLARISSGASRLRTQRDTIGDSDPSNMFSSPVQRETSAQVSQQY